MTAPRYRLRFLLQEFDLAGTIPPGSETGEPEVVIGRSPDCQITIEDPLISRRHARVVIRSDGAWVQDLGSRNGVRVNGRPIRGEQLLREGDRIRIGTQELVFSVVRKEQRPVRQTGYMRVCHACNTPYPEGSKQCPHCGAAAAADEDTLSGVTVEPRRSWTFQLLGEVIERALTSKKDLEAERLMRRAAKEVDERLAAGERLEPAHTAMIAQFAVRLARLSGGSEWIAWALKLHRRQDLMLSDDVIDRLEEVDFDSFPDARAVLGGYLGWFRSSRAGTGPSPDLSRLSRLEGLARERAR